MAIVDNGIYVDGRRFTTPSGLAETFEEMSACHGMAWLGLYRPSTEELDAVASELNLHELAIEDTTTGHQRPKLDHYGSHNFLVLLPARYLDDVEKVEFGELHVYTGKDFVVTIRQAESPALNDVRRRMEQHPDLLAMGPRAVVYAVVDRVVDEYEPVIDGLANDIGEIEDELVVGNTDVSRRIYELSREVIELQRATGPLVRIIAELRHELTGSERAAGSAGTAHVEHGPGAGASGVLWPVVNGVSPYAPGARRPDPEPVAIDPDVLALDHMFADVQDHAIQVVERVASFRALLTNALSLSATLVSQQAAEAGLAQNEQMKKISSWAAILFAPSLVGSIYGMNFHHMPELSWWFGYPLALVSMVLLSGGLWFVFKRNKWL